MQSRLLLSCVLALSAACAPVSARDLVQLDVIDRDEGRWLPEYRHRGDEWIAGVPGHRYAVRLTNTTGERVLVVLSVDGVNAVTGQTASPSQAGYVLEPWETAEIAGWRKSYEDIAQFVFTDLPDSYAARTGRPADVGVIGIAVFRERAARPVYSPASPPPPPPVAAPSRTRERAAADSAIAESAPQRLGTGHGQREWAPVGRTEFVRASRSPQQVSALRYDDHATLAALGVLGRRGPEAFPGGFVADPPRW